MTPDWIVGATWNDPAWISAVSGAFSALIAGILAWRELFYLPRKTRQEVLNRLPRPATKGLNWGKDDRSFQDKVDEIVKNGLDASELRAKLVLPDRHLWKTIQRLYEENRIDVFLLKGSIAHGGPPGVPRGTGAVLPIFVLGQLPPDMRPKRSEVEGVLSDLRRQGRWLGRARD